MSEPSEPPAVHQASSNPQDVSQWCPFCTIATTFTPIDPRDHSNRGWDPEKLSPPGYVILSTEHVIAFLDIAPLTRGHVLVAPRKHRMKMGDFNPFEMAEIGRMLPIISRAVLQATLPDIPLEDADYNIVQNNGLISLMTIPGPGAAQVIPHVHFHIIPRPPLNYVQPTTTHINSSSSSSSTGTSQKYPRSKPPTGIQQSYIQFGRGPRHELDDDDAAELVQVMRRNVAVEWGKEFGGDGGTAGAAAAATTTTTMTEPGIERFMGGAEDAAWIEGSGGLVSNLQRRTGGGGGSGRRKDEKL